MKTAAKLHRQFGHPSSSKLLSLIKNAGVVDKKLEEAVISYSDSCDTCRKFSRPSPRPVVSLPMATDFNETVAMDLKYYEGGYFLVLVDLATRFCAAASINNKRPNTIIKLLFTRWISLFGPPNKFLSDNGCEFNNAEMRELGEVFNVEILTTSAESPWSNGACERLNGLLGDSVTKIRHESPCDIEIALAWAVSARNSLANNFGFSPNQMVFGKNPVFPSILSNEPPANEKPSVSKTVVSNLGAMHSAREEFLKKESCERLQRAMRHNVRETKVDDLRNGDQVYYKRNDSKEWRGPGVVIGRDGKQVLVRHGVIYVRAHLCRLVHTPCVKTDLNYEELRGATASNEESNAGYSSEGTDIGEEVINQERLSDASERILLPEPVRAVDPDSEPTSSSEQTAAPDMVDAVEQPVRSLTSVSKPVKVVIGQRVKGIHTASGEAITGRIVSRAGKTTGRNKNCYNIQRDSDNSVQWYDIKKDFEDFDVVPDEAEMLVLFNTQDVMAAKDSEIKNWRENGVFEEVENEGQTAISARWVVTEKQKGKEVITKARLVARGFEEETTNMRKDSPTCSKEAVRLVLALASTKEWECHTLDVKAAYLQGGPILRDVFLMPPPEYYCGKLWKLKKTVYGLCDAARAWYLRVKEELLKLGARMCKLDSALFSFVSSESLQGVVCVYVDDFLWAGTAEFEKKVIKKLSSLFLIGCSESGAFKYVGVSINYNLTTSNVSVDQIQYASSLKPVHVSRQRANDKSNDLSDMEKVEYRSLIGQLNWIATQTRPDLAFDICELSGSCGSATVGDLMRLNKIVERVKTDNVKLTFQKMEALDSCHLECYSDASFANLPGGGSQGGLIIFLRDSCGARCPIYWRTRKIPRVVKSTLSAETLALLDCAEAAVYIASILAELTPGKARVKIHCYTDNKSLLDSLHSSKRVEDRRLRLDLAVIQDMLDNEEITSVSWVATSMQLADCLTKRGASTLSLRDAIAMQ